MRSKNVWELPQKLDRAQQAELREMFIAERRLRNEIYNIEDDSPPSPRNDVVYAELKEETEVIQYELGQVSAEFDVVTQTYSSYIDDWRRLV